ncbi:MAG TPA: tetratricopeptide repeat protein, partial [Verrucomicrobiae bacterium]|nr:tetratricopeptide repeat protein [Verrucomicrobiae bacterium]
MPEKSLSQVNPELRELYQKGNAALQRNNLDYAIAIFEQILQQEPAFWECRQALRASQFKKIGANTSFFKKMLGGASSSPLLAKAQMSLRKHPLESLQTAEQILRSEPSSSAAHKILAEAALAADLPKTACLSLEIVLKNSPKDYDVSVQYGQALARAGQVEKAESVYTDLMRSHPQKGELAQFLKDLSARRTMTEGGYEGLAGGQGSY